MKSIMLLAVALAAPVLLAAPAHADDDNTLNLGRMTRGYSYYNRPGATMAMHDAAVSACLADAMNMRSIQDQMRGGIGGILGGLIADAQADSANRGVVSASLENCMVVRGWRVVHLDDAEGEALSKLPAADLSGKLAAWVGAETPHGTVVRSWHNDAALGAVNHFSLHAQHTKNGQLSLLAIGTTVSTALKSSSDHGEPDYSKLSIDPKWPKKAVKPEMLDTGPAGSAIIVVNVKGVSLRQGNGFTFTRVGASPLDAPSVTDNGTDHIMAVLGTIAASSDGKFFAFIVPPGRWRLNSFWSAGIELNFCLGSPSFEVKAGDVVYAGQLDLKQDKLMPNFDLAPAKAWMGPAKATERLRPAAYVNGSRGRCGSTSIYALEFDGLPFEDGYDLGSKVPPVAAMAATRP